MHHHAILFTITRFVAYDNAGPLKAFCDVIFSQRILIKGIRIVEGRTGPFVSMPRQQNRVGKWYDSVVPLTKETREELTRVVLEAYKASIEQEAASRQPSPDRLNT